MSAVMFFEKPSFLRDPYPHYATLRELSPVCRLPGVDAWIALNYPTVRRIIDDHVTYSSVAAPGGGKPLPWLIFSDPPRHTQLRALVQKAFTPQIVARLEPRIAAISQSLLAAIRPRGQFDLVADYSAPLPLMVIAELIGRPPSDNWSKLKAWSDAILGLANTIFGGPDAMRAVEQYRAASAEMNDLLAVQVAARRQAPTADLLSALVHAEVEGQPLSPADLLGFFQLLLLAGNETTTNLISNAMICLLDHPEQLAALRTALANSTPGQTPPILVTAIEEVLRFRSPVQCVFRQTTREVELAGQQIPAGKLVLLGLGAANRDPRVFSNPDRFDIARATNSHVAFGFGPHFCLGAALARLEARVALEHLLTTFDELAYAGSDPWQPRSAFHVHGPTSLPLNFRASN
jgi:cytochrome P450